jgi:hypothetical protein
MIALHETPLKNRAKPASPVKAMNTAAIAEATGLSWDMWCKKLDAAGAMALKHAEIVAVAQRIEPDISGWWAQGIAVAYEQHIGRRKPGQMSDGTYSASATRTLTTTRGDAFDQWCTFANKLAAAGNLKFKGPASTSETPKRSYWRRSCEDGSKAVIGFESKASGRVLVAVEHQKLKSRASLAATKAAWVKALAQCFDD